MAVPPRVREPLEEDERSALAPGGAVGGRGERFAASVGGETTLVVESEERGGRGHHTRPAREREPALLLPERGGGEVERDEGGGARGVDGDGGSFQPEGVGDAAGDDAGGVARQRVPLRALRGLPEHANVVLAGGAGEHARVGATQRLRVDAGALQGLPGNLEQQPLLRVHRDGLTRGDPEEGGIEIGDVGEEAPFTGSAESRWNRPPSVLGEGGDRIGPGDHQPPQVLWRADAAREPAGHRDDRDRLAVTGLQLPHALPGLVQFRGNPLQVVPQSFFVRHSTPPESARTAPSSRFPTRGGIAGHTRRTMNPGNATTKCSSRYRNVRTEPLSRPSPKLFDAPVGQHP